MAIGLVEDETHCVAADVYRRAQIHFRLYHSLLPVSLPGPPGIMHWTYPIPLYVRGWKNVYTVHDVIPIERPELSPVSPTRLYRTLQAISKVADRITTISQHSLHSITALGIFRPVQIVNVSLAVEPPVAILPGENLPNGLKPKDYLLFIGSVEPRKNIGRLLEAYRHAQLSMPLVIVGPATLAGVSLESEIRTTPGVIRLTYQTAASHNALLAGARALVFPSLAEGFGLPVVEAMARGTAVITSNIPAICETAEGAAILVDPTNVGALSDCMKAVAIDFRFAEALAAEGLLRAQRYSENAFASRLASVYTAALERE